MSTTPKTTTNAIAKDDGLFFQDADLAVREEGDFIMGFE
jgi:hypothetical protein